MRNTRRVNNLNDKYSLLYLVSDRRVFCYESFNTDYVQTDVQVLDMSLDTNRPGSRIFHLHAPPNAKIQELEFSPHGDRVAWLVEQDQGSTPTTFMNGTIPLAKADTKPTIGIWVCQLNGTRMHEVGYQTLVKNKPSDHNTEPETDSPNPENVQWLPDGHRLSFIYRGALYIVPAD